MQLNVIFSKFSKLYIVWVYYKYTLSICLHIYQNFQQILAFKSLYKNNTVGQKYGIFLFITSNNPPSLI